MCSEEYKWYSSETSFYFWEICWPWEDTFWCPSANQHPKVLMLSFTHQRTKNSLLCGFKPTSGKTLWKWRLLVYVHFIFVKKIMSETCNLKCLNPGKHSSENKRRRLKKGVIPRLCIPIEVLRSEWHKINNQLLMQRYTTDMQNACQCKQCHARHTFFTSMHLQSGPVL